MHTQRPRRTLVLHLLIAVAPTAGAGAQSRQPPAPADYGQWEALAPQPRGLSPDAKWIVYGINRSNRENELRIVGTAGGTAKVAAFGAQPAFSADSKWLAHAIGVSEREDEYNVARRAKKPVVLLAYGGEDHGLRKKANQVDYQHRILQWFGHYLKNEPAPRWITEGTSVLEREQELKRAKAKKGS